MSIKPPDAGYAMTEKLNSDAGGQTFGKPVKCDFFVKNKFRLQ